MSSAPLYTLDGVNQARGLDANLWRQKLQDYASNDPQFGFRFTDDFQYIDAAKWDVEDAAAGATGATITQFPGPDGVMRLNDAGTTNHHGGEVHGSAFVPTVKADGTNEARGDLVFQARVDFQDADTIFVGLSEDGATLLSATSTLPADEDFIGFYTADNGTTLTFYSRNDNAAGTAVEQTFVIPSDAVADSGWQNLGFRVNKDGSVEVAVNGFWYGKGANGIDATALPIELLVPRFAATAGGGTTAPTLDIDRIDLFVAQA